MAKGYIYIFTYPLHKEIKIGYSKDVKNRLKSLSRGQLARYSCYAIYEVDGDSKQLQDRKLHDLIDIINPELRCVDSVGGRIVKGEYFDISKEHAYALLECIAKITGTESNLHYTDDDGNIISAPKKSSKPKQSKTKFFALGIKIGDILEYSKDSGIKVKVVDDGYVDYNGKITALSPLATKLLGYKRGVRGTAYFKFNGETLVELRKRLGV